MCTTRSMAVNSMSTATSRVLIAAAKLRVTTDRKLGLVTPEWVVDLAGQTKGGTVAQEFHTEHPNAPSEGLRSILQERERELLEAKGHCRNTYCSLHCAHSGPCNMAAQTSTRRIATAKDGKKEAGPTERW